MEVIVVLLIVVFWILLCGFAAAGIANSKGANGGLYFLFGVLFGPIVCQRESLPLLSSQHLR